MPILRFRFTAALVAMSVGFEPALLAVDSRAAAYIGGTVAQFSATTGPLDGILDTRSQADLTFWPDESPFRDMPLKIPYTAITELEYGEKAGRRVGVAIATSVLLTPLGLLALMSKKRSHFLTVAYQDAAGADQVAIFEIGKGIVRTSLAIIETRSGKRIQFQDEEALAFAGRPSSAVPPAEPGDERSIMPPGPRARHASEAMTNADVVRLCQAGVDAEVIVTAIRSAKARRFDVQPAALVGLTEAGVPMTVILEMQASRVPEAPPSPQTPGAETNTRPPARHPVCVLFWCR